MKKRNWTLAAAAAITAAAALLGAPAQAQVNASIFVQVAPPAPLYEARPAPRRHHAWVPGHWEWRRHQHVWVPGHFVRARAGYHHGQPRWVRHGSRWGYHPGGWSRVGHRGPDRDRDGIPDRRDRDLDNDGRPNHRDWDRDGDGIANHRDRAPDHRRRY